MKYLLDTHVWIWWNAASHHVSDRVARILRHRKPSDELLLSAISPWEFCKLLERKRLAVTIDPERWLEQALRLPRLRLVPLTPTIAYHSTILPQPFHDDPADQIIVATAREENATILTKDRLILGYEHARSLWD